LSDERRGDRPEEPSSGDPVEGEEGGTVSLPALDLQEAKRALGAAEVEADFWRKNRERLLKQYPDHFVAVSVKDGQVVATSPDLYRLMLILEEAGRKPDEMWVRFLSAGTRQYIL